MSIDPSRAFRVFQANLWSTLKKYNLTHETREDLSKLVIDLELNTMYSIKQSALLSTFKDNPLSFNIYKERDELQIKAESLESRLKTLEVEFDLLQGLHISKKEDTEKVIKDLNDRLEAKSQQYEQFILKLKEDNEVLVEEFENYKVKYRDTLDELKTAKSTMENKLHSMEAINQILDSEYSIKIPKVAQSFPLYSEISSVLKWIKKLTEAETQMQIIKAKDNCIEAIRKLNEIIEGQVKKELTSFSLPKNDVLSKLGTLFKNAAKSFDTNTIKDFLLNIQYDDFEFNTGLMEYFEIHERILRAEKEKRKDLEDQLDKTKEQYSQKLSNLANKSLRLIQELIKDIRSIKIYLNEQESNNDLNLDIIDKLKTFIKAANSYKESTAKQIDEISSQLNILMDRAEEYQKQADNLKSINEGLKEQQENLEQEMLSLNDQRIEKTIELKNTKNELKEAVDKLEIIIKEDKEEEIREKVREVISKLISSHIK